MSKKNPIVKVPGVKVTLAGEGYVIPPLNLGALEQLQERLSAFDGSIDPGSISVVVDATHAALLRNYPEMTRDEVADIVDLSNMDYVMRAVMDMSGLLRKEQEAAAQEGGAAAVDPSTGASATPT